MNELEELENLSLEVVESYQHSQEFVNLEKIITAMGKDKKIQELTKKLDALQAICRTKEGDIFRKKEVLKEIEKTKALLYSLPLWTNYVQAKIELNRLRDEIIVRLSLQFN